MNKLKDFYLLSGIDDVFASIGLKPGEKCAPEQLIEQANELIETFSKDTTKTLANIVKEIGVNLIAGIAALIAKLVTSNAAAYFNNVLAQFIMGNFVGALIGIIAAVLSSYKFFEIYLAYLASKYLRDRIQKRKFLSELLIEDIDMLLNLFKNFNELFDKQKLDQLIDIKKALEHVKKAQFLIGVEISRVLEEEFIYGSPRVIQITNIKEADKRIDKAIDILTNNTYSIISNRIDNIKLKYNLQSQIPVVPDPVAWANYFGLLNNEIKEKYFTYISPIGTAAYENEKRQKERIYRELIFELFVEMPSLLQLLVISQMFASATKFMSKRIPIFSSYVLYKNLISSDYTAWLVPGEVTKKVFSFLSDTSFTDQKENRAKYVLNESTLDSLNSEIKFYEFLILMFPNIYKSIRKLGYLYLDFLKNAEKTLNEVKLDMLEVISEEEINRFNLIVKKNKWVGQLSYAKAQLIPIISDASGIINLGPNFSLNALEIQDFIDKVGEKLEALQTFIKLKTIDQNTGERFDEPAETFVTMSQELFGPLFNEITFLISAANSKTIIEKLQSLKFLLLKQKELDEMELKYLNGVVTTAESHSAFPKIEKAFNDFLASLNHPQLNEITNSLANGDILTIATAASVLQSVSNVVQLLSCAEQKAPNIFDDLKSAINIAGIKLPELEKLKKLQEKVIQGGLQDLKRKKVLLDKMITKVEEVIEKANLPENKEETAAPIKIKNKQSNNVNINQLKIDLKSLGILLYE